MVRETFINILNRTLTKEISEWDIRTVLTEYCKRKDKENKYSDLINDCIHILIQTNKWHQYFERACRDLMYDFNVETWYDKERPVKTPFGETMETKILGYL